LTVLVALRAGTLDIGWEVGSLDGGIGRVVYGFGVGLLVQRWYRTGKLRLPLNRWLTIAGLLIALMVPSQDLRWTMIVEFALLPPLLVAAVALPDQRAGRAGEWLGRCSYPLYAIHVPLLALVSGALKMRGGAADLGYLLYLIALPLLALAWAAVSQFDEPIRTALNGRLFARPRPDPALAMG